MTNIHIQVWETVTRLVQLTLPECSVYRDYDPLTRFAEVEAATKPLVCVVLGGNDPKRISQIQVQDNYEFVLTFYRFLSAQGWEAKRAEADACMDVVTKLEDAFTEKTARVDGLELKLKRGELEGGNFYDVEYYAEMEMLEINFALSVTHFREVGDAAGD